MGCCTSRKETGMLIESSFINPFEERLGFSKYPYKDIKKHISSPKLSAHFSYPDLLQLLNSLSLPFHEFSEFYNYFERSSTNVHTSKKYSYLKLQSLFILLSKDDLKTKLTYWVSLYEAKNKSLSKVKIDEMLENLIKVSVDYFQGYLCSRNKDNIELLNYEQTARTGKHFLLEETSRKIRKDKQVISIEEFQSNCFLLYGKKLFSPSFFRQKSYVYGLRYQASLKAEKIEKKKTEELFVNSREVLEYKIKPSHSRANSNVTVKNSFELFSSESTRNIKENLRYGCTSTNPPTKHTKISIRQASEEKSLNTQRTIRTNFLFPSGDMTSPAIKREVGIKRLFTASPGLEENEDDSDETEKSLIL